MSKADDVRTTGLSTIGWAYVLGANGPKRIDCSGVVYYCMRQNGIPWKNGQGWPRLTADDYARQTVRITQPERVGDVAYWAGVSGHVYHIALCIGNDEMVEARGRAWGVVHYHWHDGGVHDTVRRKAKYGRFPWLALGGLEDDLDQKEHQWLQELREMVAPQSSYREAMAVALQAGLMSEVKRLNTEFYEKWPEGVSGLPKGWKP